MGLRHADGAGAGGSVPTKICVVNLQSAMLSTKEGQAAADEFRTKFAEPEEKKLQAKQAEITDLNDKLQRGANTMSQTAQDDMKRTLDRKNTEYKRAVEDYQFDRDEDAAQAAGRSVRQDAGGDRPVRAGKRLRDIPGRDQPEFGNHVDLGSRPT